MLIFFISKSKISLHKAVRNGMKEVSILSSNSQKENEHVYFPKTRSSTL